MSFSAAIEAGQRQAEKKSARELRAELHRHGALEQHDLSTLQSLRARFPELPGRVFDQIVREVQFKEGR